MQADITIQRQHDSGHTSAPGDGRTPGLAEFGERLVTLCDGRAGLRQGVHTTVQEADSSNASSTTLDFISSSEALDRYNEIILADGWTLDNYRRNPVFQNAHQYGDIIFTLGKALVTEVRFDGSQRVLFQRIEFATDVNPMARIAYGLYKGKFLNAVSVGFIPLRWETGGADSPFRRKYLEQELLEVSAVGIPANPEALQLGLKAGAIQKSDLRDLLDLLSGIPFGVRPSPGAETAPSPAAVDHSHAHKISSVSAPENGRAPKAVPDAHAGASGARNYEAQLLQLARDLKQLITRT